MPIWREPRRCRGRARLSTALAVAVAIATASCGVVTGDADDERGAVATGLEQLPLVLLEAEPTTESPVEISVVDFDALSAAHGVERPDPSDTDATIEWLVGFRSRAADGPAPVPHLPGYPGVNEPTAIETWNDEFGFELGEADVAAGFAAAPSYFTAFGPALDDPTGSMARLDGSAEVATVGQGEDLSLDLESRSPARPLGRPARVAADDGWVAIGLSTPIVEGWGEGPSLLADAAIADVARALDRHEVVTATIFRNDFTFGVVPADGPPLPPFTLVGIGSAVGPDDAGETLVVAYRFDDAATADDALGALELRWNAGSTSDGDRFSDHVSVTSVEADDATVTVTATSLERADLARLWLFRGETLFTVG